jgi:hypothetical protein
VALPTYIYARTGDENNRVLPQVALNGVVEAWERFFYIDGAINITQQYYTPFGARPASPVNAPATSTCRRATA